MYAQMRWHADGLRWLGSLLLAFAERLERSSTDSTPAPDACQRIDEARSNIASRYY